MGGRSLADDVDGDVMRVSDSIHFHFSFFARAQANTASSSANTITANRA